MTLLRARDLSLTHDGSDRPSPQQVSFEVGPGEVVLVLGPSGSGKSTLTLALNGLIPQTVPATIDGTVHVRDRDTRSTPVAALSADVAMVFQDPDAQLITGTLLDEVAFALENLLLPVDEVLARAEAALRRVGLWERRDENPDRLSGGGRQRLAIACAVAIGAPLIVLDEPTANLDPQGIDDVYAALHDLVAAGDRSILLVEHNLDAAMRFATRVLVLDRDGRLAYDGPADEVLRDHADELIEMGVWLPAATLAGRMLRGRGILPADAPLPLTPEELAGSLPEPVDALPARDEPDGREKDDRAVERADAAPLIRVRGLTVRKGGAEILHGIDLDIDPGSFTAIVGANGAGKTTLIHAIAGVVPPPQGQVDVDGMDPSTASPRDLSSRIGFVFQNPEHQFITHTVFDELAHGLRRRRAPDAEIAERVDGMLRRFGLEDKADVHPFLLSGGEKRRLSVGTALITHPRVLVLDEPTFGQDRARAEELLRLLDDLRDEGTTIVIVTHDLQLVAEHATHTVVLSGGRVHAAGRTADLFAADGLLESAGLRLPVLHRALPAPLRMLLATSDRAAGAGHPARVGPPPQAGTPPQDVREDAGAEALHPQQPGHPIKAVREDAGPDASHPQKPGHAPQAEHPSQAGHPPGAGAPPQDVREDAGPDAPHPQQPGHAPKAGHAPKDVREDAGADDPYAPPAAASAWRYLLHLNPLAKISAVLPAMIVLVFVRDLVTPAAFILLGYAVVLTGARITRRTAALLAGIPVGIALIGAGFSLWISPETVADHTPVLTIGAWTLTAGALQAGFATGLRLGAILMLALVGGITTSGPDLVRAAVRQLHVPYRIGYTALAAYRFVPRFGHELSVIRAAHRVRGRHGGAGPFAKVARGWGYIVPLLAGAIRHAERVALAMDARAFGAHPTRTERHVVPFRVRDGIFIAAFVAASAVLFTVPLVWPLV